MKILNKEALKTLVFLMLTIYEKRKTYYLLFVLRFILVGSTPLVTILMSRYLVLYLTQLDARNFTIIAVSLVIFNIIIGICNTYIMRKINIIHNELQIYFEEELGKKTLKIQCGLLETAEFHDSLEKAKVGIGFISGGIAGISNNINTFLSGLLTLIGTLAIISLLSTWVVLVILASSVLSITATALAQKRDANFRKRLISVNRKLGYYMNIFKDERIAKDVRLYHGVDLIESRVNEFLNTEWKLERTRTRFGNKIRVWIDIISYLNQSFLYGFFAYQVVIRIIDISLFTMFFGAGISFYSSIVTVTSQIIEIEKNLGFMGYYRNFICLPERESNHNNVLQANFSEVTIEFVNVCFKYPQSQVYSLKDVNLTINNNTKLAIVGPNGAGKTTIIKLLCRLYSPTEGQILLNGVNIEQYSDEQYSKLLSVVFQDYKTFAFTIKENLMTEDDPVAWNALKKVGLYETINQLPNQLNTAMSKSFDVEGTHFSGGETQKIAIARSITKEASLMILDEPTASLDPIAEYEIFKIFSHIVEKKNAIFISHRMASCILCDQVAVIENGTITSIGTHDELLRKNNLYKQMWEAQAQFYV